MCGRQGDFLNRLEQVLGTSHLSCLLVRQGNFCRRLNLFCLSNCSRHCSFSGGAIPQGKEWIHQCDSSAECLNKNGERFLFAKRTLRVCTNVSCLGLLTSVHNQCVYVNCQGPTSVSVRSSRASGGGLLRCRVNGHAKARPARKSAAMATGTR